MHVRTIVLVVLGMTTFVVHAHAQLVTAPIWAASQDTVKDAAARARFQEALKARGLGALEVFDLPQDAASTEDVQPGAGTLRPVDVALDKDAAMRARAKGASFALLGRLHRGAPDRTQIDLRLVDARNGLLKDSTAVSLASDADPTDLAEAVLRLDEVADKADLARRSNIHVGQGGPEGMFPVAAPPARVHDESGPSFTSDTRGWLQANWPLLTALTTAVGTALVLGILVAKDSTPARP